MERNIHSVLAPVRFLVVASAAILVALLTSGLAFAHDLKAIVDLEKDPVAVEAWFDDDTPAQAARINVVRDTGEEIAAGVTDDRGRWSFPKPGPGRYRVTIESVGHRDVIRFTIPGVETEVAPTVETEMRLNQKLGLSIGLTMLLGGSAAFIVLRRRRKAA